MATWLDKSRTRRSQKRTLKQLKKATYIFFTPFELIFLMFGAAEIISDDIIYPRPSNMYLKIVIIYSLPVQW